MRERYKSVSLPHLLFLQAKSNKHFNDFSPILFEQRYLFGKRIYVIVCLLARQNIIRTHSKDLTGPDKVVNSDCFHAAFQI